MKETIERKNLTLIVQAFSTLGQPARLKILLAIGSGEACVCHLESQMGMRQAYISQHLMALRKSGIVTDRREGRYIFYRLKNPRTLELIQLAGTLSGVPEASLFVSSQPSAVDGCCCPHCAPEIEEGSAIFINQEIESL